MATSTLDEVSPKFLKLRVEHWLNTEFEEGLPKEWRERKAFPGKKGWFPGSWQHRYFKEEGSERKWRKETQKEVGQSL